MQVHGVVLSTRPVSRLAFANMAKQPADPFQDATQVAATLSWLKALTNEVKWLSSLQLAPGAYSTDTSGWTKSFYSGEWPINNQPWVVKLLLTTPPQNASHPTVLTEFSMAPKATKNTLNSHIITYTVQLANFDPQSSYWKTQTPAFKCVGSQGEIYNMPSTFGHRPSALGMNATPQQQMELALELLRDAALARIETPPQNTYEISPKQVPITPLF